MQSKGGDREEYRERVREREGKRWRVRKKGRERERDPQKLEGEASTDHLIGEGLGWNWMNFCDHQWPLRSYLLKWNIYVFYNASIHINFYQNWFINECARKNVHRYDVRGKKCTF